MDTNQEIPSPEQTSELKRARRPRGQNRKKATFRDTTHVGMERFVGKTKSDFMHAKISRRRFLTVPQEILDANPDKHFCFVNMNKMQKNGMWHHNGFRLYDVKSDSENLHTEKFSNPIDNYLHRNEMALAWIPREEYEARLLEDKILRDQVQMEDLIVKDGALQGFAPHAKETKETLPFPSVNKQEATDGQR